MLKWAYRLFFGILFIVAVVGPKGHGAGCQAFLLKATMNNTLAGLSLYNREESGPQVIALKKGDEAQD